MSRAIERYVCASEDRSHYNNETDYLYGFRYPMRSPKVINISLINQTIREELPIEKINEQISELVSQQMPSLTETVVTELGDLLNQPVTTEEVDDAIDEIYGGSAIDMVEGGDG